MLKCFELFMAKKRKIGAALMDGRGLAIAVIALVSGTSFAFGFYVGKTTTDITKEIRIVTVSPEAETSKETSPAKETAEEPKVSTKKSVEPRTAPVKTNYSKKKSTGVYSLQVGAFSKRKDAEALQQQFKGMEYSTYLLRTISEGGKAVYKVRVGKFKEKEDAEILALKLNKINNIDAFITRN
jgi:cell division septation protein DedD